MSKISTLTSFIKNYKEGISMKSFLRFLVILIVLSSTMIFAQHDDSHGTDEAVESGKPQIHLHEKSGGIARHEALGMNPFMLDPTDIFYNSAYASHYDNFFWGDIGATGHTDEESVGQFAGLNFNVNRHATLGIMVFREDFHGGGLGSLHHSNELIEEFNHSNLIHGADVITLDNNVQLLSSFKFTRTFTMGFGFSLARSGKTVPTDNDPDTDDNVSSSALLFGFNMGMLVDFNRTTTLDFGFDFSMLSANSESNNDKGELSAMNISVTTRMLMHMNKKLVLVPRVDFVMRNGEMKDEDHKENLPDHMYFAMGFGANYVVDNFLLVGGLSLGYTLEETTIEDVDTKNSWEELVFPKWNIGIEWYATDWLKPRFGYIASSKEHTDNGLSNTMYDTEGFVMGIGLKFDNFNFDATVHDEILRQGFNLIGGGKATLAHLSMSYAF